MLRPQYICFSTAAQPNLWQTSTWTVNTSETSSQSLSLRCGNTLAFRRNMTRMEKDKWTRQKLCANTVNKWLGMCLEILQTSWLMSSGTTRASTSQKKKTDLVQTTISPSMKKKKKKKRKEPFPNDSNCAKAITNAIRVFIAANLKPYSIVENKGFRNTIRVIEHRLKMPSRS